MTVYELRLLHWEPPCARVEVVCSKGTYVRSLARDIGASIGTCAYLTALRRTAVGPFSVEEAVPPDRFDPGRHLLRSARFISRLGIPLVTASSAVADGVGRGAVRAADLAGLPACGDALLVDDEGELLAILTVAEGVVRYRAVFGGR